MTKNFVFGYGSLIEKKSRARTIGEVATIPVLVDNLIRGWWARTPVSSISPTYLGCIKKGDYEITPNSQKVLGVLFEVSSEQLSELDKREIGYERQEVEFEDIKVLDKADFSREDKVWVFTNRFKNKTELEDCLPNKNFPIIQSYVDICIEGCLQILQDYSHLQEREIVGSFIESTYGWSNFWVNDRVYPRRPFIHRPSAFEIDRCLKTYLEDKSLFNMIYFE